MCVCVVREREREREREWNNIQKWELKKRVSETMRSSLSLESSYRLLGSRADKRKEEKSLFKKRLKASTDLKSKFDSLFGLASTQILNKIK